MKKVTKDEYFYLDAVENAIDYLENAAIFIKRDEPKKWKWVAIAIHNSLYSFCIACLTGSNYDNVLTSSSNDDNERSIWYDNGKRGIRSKMKKRKNSPGYLIEWEPIAKEQDCKIQKEAKKRGRENLISFWTALARVQDQEFWMGRMIDTKALKLSEDEWKSIEWLTLEIRNGLIHFIPKHLGVSIRSMEIAVLHIARAIEFLALESNAITYFSDRNRRNRIVSAIEIIRDKLKSI